MTTSKTARLTLRLSPERKELIARGTSRTGIPLADFVTVAAAAQAHRVLSGEVMPPESRAEPRLVAASLRHPGEPNAALRALLARAAPKPTPCPRSSPSTRPPSCSTPPRPTLRICWHANASPTRARAPAYASRDGQKRQAVLGGLARDA